MSEGHRERLRQQYITAPDSLSELQRLELLLIYAIPRVDVQPIARHLLETFGSIETILRQSVEALVSIKGIGQSAAVFISLVGNLLPHTEPSQELQTLTPPEQDTDVDKFQPNLFSLPEEQGEPKPMRLFANDEILNSLQLLPEAYPMESKDAFRDYLIQKLPYSSENTRRRRASYIISRFFPTGTNKNAVSYFFHHCDDLAARHEVLFYMMLKVEQVAYLFSNEIIWPELALGRVTKNRVQDFLLRLNPEAQPKTNYETQKALMNTYSLLHVATRDKNDALHFSLRKGTLAGFAFCLCAEYPQPATISFEELFGGILHRSMLWERDWMYEQLFRLRELGVISRVTEIDTLKQFTLQVNQQQALEIILPS